MAGNLIHISVTNGHHPSYQQLLLTVLGGETSIGLIRGRVFLDLVRAPNVFFTTIDADYRGFFFVAFIRAFFGKPTAGIFLRSLQCFGTDRPIVYLVKYWGFRFIKKISSIKTLVIIPYEIYPDLEDVSDDWIDDPQLWDLWTKKSLILPDTELSARVSKKSEGRQLLIFIGAANRIKGFPELLNQICGLENELLVVVAGKVDCEFKDQLGSFSDNDIVVEDRYVTDTEILSLYKVADFAWCHYSPDYDQPSGVFGRAIQTKVIPVVRQGSLLEKIAESLEAKAVTNLSDIRRCNPDLMTVSENTIIGIAQRNIAKLTIL